MPDFAFDFRGVSDSLELPVGRYHVVAVDGESRETGEDSKHPGSVFWNVNFEVVDGASQGKHEYVNFMLPPNYDPWLLKQFLNATGKYEKDEIDSGNFELNLNYNEDEPEVPYLTDGEHEAILVVSENKGKRRTKFVPYDADEWAEELDRMESNLP